MDKQTTIGFVLIGLVLILWMWWQAPTPPPASQRQATADSIRQHTPVARDTVRIEAPPAAATAVTDTAAGGVYGRYFSKFAAGDDRRLIIRTEKYTAELSTHGALVRKWELREYLTWNKAPVQLVDYERGDFSLLFTSGDGRLIDTKNLYFTSNFPSWETVELTGNQSYSVEFTLQLDGGAVLTKRMTFTNGTYAFDADFKFQGFESIISNFEYQVVWENGLNYAEHNSVDESSFAMGYVYSGGELAEVDATKEGEVVKRDINGSTGWVASRTKYFTVALMPEEGKSQGAYLEGTRQKMPDHGEKENYALALKMPLKGSTESSRVTVFLGPLDYDVVRGYKRGLDQMMSLGAAWIIRPISEYVMIPLFQFLRMLIPNYGLVIIVFSIIIKIALHPLTRSSMRSMKKMQALTPLMNEIKEKYKDDQAKMNQQVMNLYKEYGVNPAAGCLPLLLQMPILFALYAVFRSSIELRQAGFVWWIKDLSIPDSIVHLPTAIPFFGITEVSGLALAMGITMFLQQKMTVTDPRQKMMVWMMPVLMTLMFNGLPSGLNLYYFVFNVLSIGQQFWVNKQHADEPLRKVEPKKKKGGLMGRITKDLPKLK